MTRRPSPPADALSIEQEPSLRGALRRGAIWLVPISLLALGCSSGGSNSGAPQGCAKDTDCKGSRVCVNSVCADPPGTGAPTQTAASTKPAPTTTATVAAKPTATAAADTGPRPLTAAEQGDLNKVLSRFNVDYTQTFHLALNGFGECVVASTIFKENQDGDFLVVADGKTYPLPKWADTKPWTRDKVKGVWFGKLDKDDLTDVITIADYMTGVGASAAKPFPVVQYYFASGPKAFRLDEALSRKATDKGITSIAAARDLAKGDAPEKQCTGENANSELPCTLENGLVGWCKGGRCKTVCPAGYSYDPLDTQCHQPRDCKYQETPDGTIKPVKTAKCNECMGAVCFDAAATRPMN